MPMVNNIKKTIEFRLEPTLNNKQFYLDFFRPYYDSIDNLRLVRYDSMKSLTREELKQLADFIIKYLEDNP
jgi:two-component SAPR family response regulator